MAKVDEPKVWKKIRLRGGNIHYQGELLKTKWVRFVKDKSDGLHNWRAGHVIEWPYSTEKLMLYLEHDVVVPCDPPKPRKPEEPCLTIGEYRFLTAVASEREAYAQNQTYTLTTRKGDKYVERGIAIKVRDVGVEEVRQHQPERATKR